MKLGHKFSLSAVLLSAQCLCGAHFANATSVVYTYTGNDFQYASPGSPYSLSDSLTGSVTLSAALGDDVGLVQVNPTSFSFSDGVQTISSCASPSFCSFFFVTGPTGSIVQWDVTLLGSNYGIVSQNLAPPFSGSAFAQDQDYVSSGYGNVAFDPGTWTGPTATPVPSALPLFASGLGALGLFGWRRKRKAM